MKIFRLNLCNILLFLMVAFFSQTALASGEIDGRWYLTFDLPDSIYRTAVSFKVDAEGKVKPTMMGEPNLYLTDGVFDGKDLKLNGKSGFGNVVVTAKFDGAKISGRWSLGFLGGEMNGEREPADKAKSNYVKVFEQTWQTVNDKFYDPKFNGIDWKNVKETYRIQVLNAKSDEEFINLMRKMLKELKVSHVGFYYSPFAQEVTVKNQPVKPQETFKGITWKKISPEVGYIQIKSFTEVPGAIELVDQAFAEVGDSPNLIIDLRGNTGGALGVAMRLGDYFFDKQTPVGFFSSRIGLKNQKVNTMDEINVKKLPVYNGYILSEFWESVNKNGAVAIVSGGRSPKVYRGKIVFLIDEGCASTTEGFTAVIKEFKVGTLIGRKTRGAVLSMVVEKTADDWLVKFPKADYRTPQGKRIEGVGVEPDITAEKGKEIEAALQFLGKSN